MDSFFTSAHDSTSDSDFVWGALALLLLWGACFTLLAASLVQLFAPQAAGSGVALVMGFLNGNYVPDLLRFSTLLVKIIGTACSCIAGLPVGPEGPLIHIGAASASCLAHLRLRALGPCAPAPAARARDAVRAGSPAPSDAHTTRLSTPTGSTSVLLDPPGTPMGAAPAPPSAADDEDAEDAPCCGVPGVAFDDADQREFVSAGAAAGLAAAFGAPIGGVLFAMEEACTFWTRKVRSDPWHAEHSTHTHASLGPSAAASLLTRARFGLHPLAGGLALFYRGDARGLHDFAAQPARQLRPSLVRRNGRLERDPVDHPRAARRRRGRRRRRARVHFHKTQVRTFNE